MTKYTGYNYEVIGSPETKLEIRLKMDDWLKEKLLVEYGELPKRIVKKIVIVKND